ncbi:MAG: hypothetical protein ACXU85_23620 [Xanthobacteraceae bacterium]
MPYRHTQRGIWIVVLCLALAVFCALAWRTGQWIPVAVIVVVFAVAVVFSSLTVEVGEGELRCYFGPGFWSYRLQLADIETATVVRNRWWNCWGRRTQ